MTGVGSPREFYRSQGATDTSPYISFTIRRFRSRVCGEVSGACVSAIVSATAMSVAMVSVD